MRHAAARGAWRSWRTATSILPLLIAAAPGWLGAQAQQLVITGATVVDVAAGRRLPGQTIVISGHRIVAVGRDASVRPPSGGRVLDARGKFVIPGLWDMHVHATGPVLDRLFLPILAAHGVTGVRDMWGRFAWFDSVRAQVARGTLVAPRVVGSGHILDGAPAIWPGSTGVKDVEETRRVVDSLAAGGAAFIKVYSRLSPESFRAAAERASARGLPFAGHVPSLVSVAEASDLGMRSIELRHLVAAGFSPLEALRTATVNPARFLGAADSLGAVRTGYVADLVVLDADPLADIGNTERVHAVILNGRLIDAAERQRLLEAGRALASGRPDAR